MQPRSQRTGRDQEHPLLLGDDDQSGVVLVETTGLSFGLHKGQQRWVTGTHVQPGIEAGLLMVIRYSDGFSFDALVSPEPAMTGEDRGEQVVQGTETPEEPASAEETGGGAAQAGAGEGDATDDYAAVAAAHAAYEADGVAAMSIPKTKLWVGTDLARAEVVEARESTRGDVPARAGVMAFVTDLLGD